MLGPPAGSGGEGGSVANLDFAITARANIDAQAIERHGAAALIGRGQVDRAGADNAGHVLFADQHWLANQLAGIDAADLLKAEEAFTLVDRSA